MSHARESVGFPLLVKAAVGGGGKGMKLARSLDEVAEAILSAKVGFVTFNAQNYSACCIYQRRRICLPF